MLVLINDGVPAKGCSYTVETFKGRSESFVKACKYEIISMQNVHPLAQRPLDAAIEVSERAHVTRLANKVYPASGYSPYERLGIIKGGSVVNYFDLHFFSTGILRQDTSQCFLQVPRPVVRRDHDRPKGPPASLGWRANPRCYALPHNQILSTALHETLGLHCR
jgi:hypothetical protein